MWPIGSSRSSQNFNSKAFCSLQDYRSSGSGQRVETLFIGALKEEKEKKEKDNQYKLKKAMAIAIGLTKMTSVRTSQNCLERSVTISTMKCAW